MDEECEPADGVTVSVTVAMANGCALGWRGSSEEEEKVRLKKDELDSRIEPDIKREKEFVKRFLQSMHVISIQDCNPRSEHEMSK